MTRFRHTIALTLSAVAVTAAGALASPGDPPVAMPHDSSAMGAMPHDASEMAAMHASMASDATMADRMTSMHGGDAAGMHGGMGGGDVGMGEPRHEAHHGG
jgi:hypothetical protein